MNVLKSIHHINFVVADLDASVSAYQDVLGIGPFQREELPERCVSTARVQIGDIWVVLVSPHQDDCDVGRYLAAHGEGFFLMSFGVDDLDRAIGALAARGTVAGDARAGLLDWQVADLNTEKSLGVRYQVAQVGGQCD